MAPPFNFEPWEIALIVRLRQLRKCGRKAALVHLDSEPSVREVGCREKLIDKPENQVYPVGNNLAVP
jgi:hypothetical protein